MIAVEKATESAPELEAETASAEAPVRIRPLVSASREQVVSRPRQILGRAQAVLDLLLLVPAFLLAYQLRQAFLGPFTELQWNEHLQMAQVAALLWFAAGSYLGLYSGRWLPLRKELKLLAVVVGVTALIAGSAMFLLKMPMISRPFALLFAGTAFAHTFAIRLALRARAAAATNGKRRVIVVGNGPQLEALCAAVEEQGAELVGVIPEDERARAQHRRKVLGKLEDAELIFRQQVVDEVIFAVPKTRLAQVEDAFAAAEDLGLETKLSLNFLPNKFAKIDYEELGGTPMLSFRSAPAHPVQLAIKRVFDIAVSFSALVLGAPVFLAIAVAVKLSSKGPVFFGQGRSGLNGREFTMWKFRSMVPDAEKKLAELKALNEVSGPVFKMEKDPRVTGIGRILRKTSLDELPQFWNVLVGEMSIVGPRPPIPGEVRQYARWQRRRLSVKPGITCLWQISGRSDVDFDNWMKLDLEYIDRWSVLLDFEIFMKTVPAVLFGRGAK